MPSPASRLLELLELLQTQPLTTGREIADLLAIDRRTVRRYVATLQELGIPVEGERGVGGGYRLRPGYRLPPLMLGDDEAIAVALGLIAAGRQGLSSADGALAKIERVLPDTLRRRVEALETNLAAHDHARRDLRTFRVDRMSRVAAGERSALPPPDGFDPVAHVSRSLARVPWPWQVEVLLDLPVDQAAQRLPGTLAELLEADGRTLLRMRVSSLDWMAGLLAGLGCDFIIKEPEELRASVEQLARRLALMASARDAAHLARG